MRKINESGFPFFNCKNIFSAVLMAVADADYCFISVEFEAYGSWSDCNNIWKITGEHYTEHSRPQNSAH
jgi:hypothetical protein